MLLSVPSEVLWSSAQSLFVGSWDVGCCHPASDIDLGKNKGGSTALRCLLLSAASGMLCDALGGQEGVGGGVGVGQALVIGRLTEGGSTVGSCPGGWGWRWVGTEPAHTSACRVRFLIPLEDTRYLPSPGPHFSMPFHAVPSLYNAIPCSSTYQTPTHVSRLNPNISSIESLCF